eukprot:gene7115-7867_t
MKCAVKKLSVSSVFCFISGKPRLSPSVGAVFVLACWLAVALQVDDSPAAPLALPFPFLFGNQLVKVVFVNANGAIQMSKAPPCFPDNTFLTKTCQLTNSYYNTIAGYLVDLNANNCSNSSVRVYSQRESLTVQFVQYCYYGTNLRNTFSISLRDDHSVFLRYDLITPYASAMKVGSYCTGYRFPKSFSSTTGLQVDVSQGTISNTVWNTITGIYPPSLTSLQTGRAFTICPISPIFTLTPQNFSLPSNANLTTDSGQWGLAIRSILLSCAQQINLTLLFTNSLLNMTPTSERQIPCVIDNTTLITCNGWRIMQSASSLFSKHPSMKVVSFNLTLSWSSIYNTSKVTAIPMTAMTLFVNNYHFPYLATGCGVNKRDTCLNSAFCENSSSCYNNTCSNTSSHPWPPAIANISTLQNPVFYDIFDVLDCENAQCAHDISGNNDFTNIFVQDSYSYCCNVSSLDCGGLCLYNDPYAKTSYSKLSRNSENSTVCCSYPNVVDCLGVCGGNAVYDACSVCNGGDFVGTTCFNKSEVILSASSIPLEFIVGSVVNVTRRVWVTNNSSSVISFAFSSKSSNNADKFPSMVFNSSFRVLSINQSTYVDFTFSLANAFAWTQAESQLIVAWEVKSLQFTYYRNAYIPSKFYQYISVYPHVDGCARVGSLNTCMSLPGCIYCLDYESMRIIRNNDNSRIRSYYVLTGTSSSAVPATSLLDGSSEVDADRRLLNEEEGNKADQEESFLSSLWKGLLQLFPAGRDQVSDEPRRKLFSSIAPPKLKNKGHSLFDGRCVQGWEYDNCNV